MKTPSFPSKALLVMGALLGALSPLPASAQLTQGQAFGLSGGNAYRNNVAFDAINQVYLVIVQRPPVTGRFYNKNGVQIGQDFVISTEGGYNAWASVAFGGTANDPAFLVTYVSAQGNNPKWGRLVRFNGGTPSVTAPSFIVEVGSEWTSAEKAQNVWSGSKFIVGSRVKNAGASFPTFQVNHLDLSGAVSGGIDLGDGADYYGSPAIACVPNSTCLAVGYMAGVPTNYSGGSYARLFNGSTLAPQGNLFFLSTGLPNEDQGVVYQSHLGRFLTEWFRGGGPEYIDTRIVNTDGSMSTLDLTRGIGPGAGSNSAAYNPGTRTTLLLTKGPVSELIAMELGDDGYPLNPGSGVVLTNWDGVVVDYLPSIGANGIDGQWLVTWELNSGGFANILSGAPPTCTYTLNPLSSGTLASGGASSSFSVTAFQSCAWSATANQSWIHTSSSGSGSGTIAYTVDANAGSSRSGSITVAGQIFSISQSAFVPPPAVLTSPAGGSTLPGASATFQWNAAVGATQYYLFVGTAPGASNIALLDMGTQLSAVVSGLPTDSSTVYVRLYSYMGGWQFNDYVFTAAAPAPIQKAQLTSPAPSSTLSNSTVTFNWTGGVNATQYYLFIGSTPGASDILSRDLGLTLSTVVAGLPVDGRTLYVRLYSYIGGWLFNDYTLTAATIAPAKAQLTSPAGGSTLNSGTVTFQWTGAAGATQYYLFVGTSAGASDIAILDMGTQLSTAVTGLPTQGETIYVRLYTYNGGWLFNDYTLTATTQPVSQKAQLTSPAPGSTLTSSTVSFNWSGGVNATQYYLFIGSTPGASDILSRDLGLTLSTVVAGLPTDSSTLYVRLYSYIGSWQFNDYTLTAATVASTKAQLTTPAGGSTLTSSTVLFQWTGGIGATQYYLFVGTSPGASDIVSRDMGTQLSTVLTGLPTGGQTIYVRLYSYIGAWLFNDYTLTATTQAVPQKAQLISPAPGSTLTSSTVLFDWTGGVGATQYYLLIGSTPGASDILIRDLGTTLSTVVAGLPTDSRTLYVRLHTYTGFWQFNDYTLTAAALSQLNAQLISPAGGSTLTSSTVTFQWTGGIGATQYQLYVGTTPGGSDIANLSLGTQLSAVVSGLPTGGQTIYVRLLSFINGVWQFNDYTLTAVGGLEEEEEAQELPFEMQPVVALREGHSFAPGLR